MSEPGKTTLWRMRMAAADEACRIEISQNARIAAGLIDAPMPEQMAKRDDFEGIVRLLDRIIADAGLLERLSK